MEGKFKQIDPSKEALVKAPAKRPPTASQMAHWITFKEEQRLDWQQSYLTRRMSSKIHTLPRHIN